MKSKVNRYLLAGFFTLVLLSAVMLSCGGSNGDDDGDTSGDTVDATVQMVLASSSVAENAGSHTVTVRLNTTGTLTSAVTVDVVDLGTGSATAGGTDYTFVTPTTVTFAIGSGNGATQTVTITLNNDTLVENDETIELQLQNVSSPATILAGSGAHQVTITDDEVATVQFAQASSSVRENVGSHTVTVQLNTTGTLASEVTVDAVDLGTGSATAGGTDYSFVTPTTVTFAVGSNDGDTQPVDITIIDDGLVEDDETIDLQLQNVGGPATILAASEDHQVTVRVPVVVFIADKDTVGVNELYAALNDGFSVVKLSGTIPPGSDVIDFKISPDGNRVAFRVGQVLPPVPIELYVSDIDGGTPPIKVSGPLAANGNVEVLPALNFDAFGWSPDSSLIAYIADQNVGVGDVYELFVSTPDGLDNFQVSGALVAGGLVLEFEWTPDSSRIAYRATQDIAGVRELYTNVPTGAGIAVKVSTALGGGRDVDAPSPTTDAFQWAPDSSRIAYLADVTDNVFELFTTLPDGSGIPVKVSADLSGSLDVNEFKWAPNSSRIAYLADQDIDNVIELYSSLPDGSINDKVSVPLVAGRIVSVFAWAPDSSLIAYIADQDTDNVFELYTSPPDGSVNNLVSAIDPIAVPGSNVINFAWSPDSSLIAYLANQETVTVNELFTSPPDGSVNNLVSALDPIAIPGSDVLTYIWAPNSSRVAYFADQDTDTILEVYSSLPDGSINDKVSGPLVGGGRVTAYAWAPDASRVAYRADQETDNDFELFSSQPDGSGNGKISGPLVADGDVSTTFEYEP